MTLTQWLFFASCLMFALAVSVKRTFVGGVVCGIFMGLAIAVLAYSIMANQYRQDRTSQSDAAGVEKP